ncbi:MAG: hypothetical protein J0I41_07340 [Filimonas sp.]|nr:hypothetical protein [Filimonas sp.]
MLSENQEFDPQQSLRLIDEMIHKAKNRFSEDGFLYLLWGWLVFACTVLQFILMHVVHYSQYYLVWTLTWPAIIYQVYYIRKKKKQRSAKLYTDSVIGFVWIAFFILMVLLITIASRASDMPGLYQLVVNPCILALYGMPVFLCGIILRFPPLVAGAIGCWILSIFAPYVPYDYQLLLVAAAMLIAWIIPGYLLRNKYRKTFA